LFLNEKTVFEKQEEAARHGTKLDWNKVTNIKIVQPISIPIRLNSATYHHSRSSDLSNKLTDDSPSDYFVVNHIGRCLEQIRKQNKNTLLPTSCLLFSDRHFEFCD
jgi:hypothetical protein